MLKGVVDSGTLLDDSFIIIQSVGVEGGCSLFIVNMNLDQIIDFIIEVGGYKGP